MLNLKVVTKNEILYQNTVKLAQFPGVDGLFGVMFNHAPMVYMLKQGRIKVVLNNDEEEFIDISGGILEVFKNQITVLTS